MLLPSTIVALILIVGGPVAGNPGVADLPHTLRKAQEIRFLGREEAAGAMPVVVRGVVTNVCRVRKDLFLQDETAGIYVHSIELSADCGIGDEIEVTGTTDAGTFAPCIRASTIARVGRGTLPNPIPTSLTPFEARGLDAQYVEASGVLTNVEPRSDGQILVVRNQLVRFHIRIALDSNPERLTRLLNEPISVRGVAVTDLNLTGRPMRPSAIIFSSIDRIRPLRSTLAPIRFRTIHQHLYDFCPEIEPFTRRSLVRGVVVARVGRRLVVQDPTGGIVVQDPNDSGFLPGEAVEAVGFLSVESRQGILHAQKLVAVGAPGLPDAESVALADIAPAFLCRRVRFSARVEGRFDRIDGTRLLVRDGLTRIEARLPNDGAADERLETGALVELTGTPVSLTHPDNSMDDPIVFLVNAPADVRVIEPAPSRPWWTDPRTWYVLATLGLVSATGLGLTAVQRHRLNLQTRQIKNSYEKEARLEDSLRQHRKLEAIGRLAGGIAHDFNNLLTVICGNSELADGMLADDHPAHDLVTDILNAGQRGAALSRQLLTFSLQTRVSLAPMALEASIRSIERLIRRLVGDTIAVDFRFGADLPEVSGDPELFHQVLLNLCSNARDAMPDGGTIVISTSLYPSSDDSPWVRLEVTDTGEGMTPEVQERMFEPFFTTREVGKGTGLGLATVYGIVQTLSGRIAVRSAPGEGSTFTIDLPATDRRAEPEPVAVEAEPSRGVGTILLVEDEDGVRNFCRRTLEIYGYRAIAYSSPEEALRLSESLDGKPDLLITDLIMPGMNGRELASRLMDRFPGLRTIFMSGYPEEEVRGIVGDLASPEFIHKPFTTLHLVSRVQDVLVSPASFG